MSDAQSHTAPDNTEPVKASPPTPTPSLRSLVVGRFRRNRVNLLAYRFVVVLLFVALFADGIAYDKPLVCKYKGTLYFPIIADYLSDLNIYHWEGDMFHLQWREAEFDWSLWPPVRYQAFNIDYQNQRCLSPFGKQRVENWKNWHYLGTTHDGRDVLSGLVHGTQISLTIGVFSVALAGLIGIVIGAIAGFYGDDRLRLSTAQIIFGLLGLVIGYFYGFQVRSTALGNAMTMGGISLLAQITIGCTLMFGISFGFIHLARTLHWIPFLAKRRIVWVDMLVSRMIEVFTSIPGLLLIITLMSIAEKKSISLIIVMIGLLAWPNVARYMRGEMLRVRNLEFVQAARSLGFKEVRVMFRHALPNSLAPVFVVLAFGVAGAILLEASLSFIGVGVPDKVVTWGSMLGEARSDISAWWLSLFPSLALFFTITSLNLLGEGIRDALDPRLSPNG
jgi:peptide/nickel transport system permease protein